MYLDHEGNRTAKQVRVEFVCVYVSKESLIF